MKFHIWWGLFSFLMTFNSGGAFNFGRALFHTAFSFCPVVGDLFSYYCVPVLTCPLWWSVVCWASSACTEPQQLVWFGKPARKTNLMMTDDDVADDNHTNDS